MHRLKTATQSTAQNLHPVPITAEILFWFTPRANYFEIFTAESIGELPGGAVRSGRLM
jgi:hypothetical protein